jgi:L-asparagine transporter-like permease
VNHLLLVMMEVQMVAVNLFEMMNYVLKKLKLVSLVVVVVMMMIMLVVRFEDELVVVVVDEIHENDYQFEFDL